MVLRLRGSTDYDELRGLARTDPPTGIPLALAALTLAGFPPAIIGLVTKYVVIQPVIEADKTWLAVVMAVNVMLGLAYYLRFVAVLFDKPEGESYVSPSPPFSVQDRQDRGHPRRTRPRGAQRLARPAAVEPAVSLCARRLR